MLIAGGRIGSTRNPYLQMMGLGDTRNLINVEQLRDLCQFIRSESEKEVDWCADIFRTIRHSRKITVVRVTSKERVDNPRLVAVIVSHRVHTFFHRFRHRFRITVPSLVVQSSTKRVQTRIVITRIE